MQSSKRGIRTFSQPARTGGRVLIGASLIAAAAAAAAGCAAAPSPAAPRTAIRAAAPSTLLRTATPAVVPPASQQTGQQASQPTNQPTASFARTVLAPATVPPVSAECTVRLTFDADGNVSPLLCPGGGVNTVAWRQYAGGGVGGGPVTSSKVLGAGPFATPQQVFQAMCSDFAHVYRTRPLTESAELLAQAYYGWSFAGDNPLTDFENLGCVGPAA
jgi:hypothetical protein